MSIRGGFTEERDAYYVRSDEGLWVRSVWDKKKGEIQASWQERQVIVGGRIVTYNENNEPIKTEPVRFAQYKDEDEWHLAGVVQLDRPGFVEFARGDMRRVIEAVMVHMARLIALGFGESAVQVVEWFKRVEDGQFVVASMYRIENGTGLFSGGDGLLFEVENLENEVLTGMISVEGHESYKLEKALEPGILRDLLLSMVPV